MIIDHSDTSNTIYNITDPLYWNKDSLNKEIDRVFDICIGCRLCFNLCPSFPALFHAVDNHGSRKREEAIKAGTVFPESDHREFLNLPEGEHASEASIEADFRGEVEDLTETERWKVIDLCYQCKLCDIVCPYTPSKEHEFQLDFPKLMTRAQAIRTKEQGLKISDWVLSNIDLSGKLGTSLAPLVNWANSNKFIRLIIHAIVGIHKDRILPKFHFETLERWFKKHRKKTPVVSDPVARAAIFGTCFARNNDPAVGKAAIEILEYNDVEVVFPKQQCCGAPFLLPGDFNRFRKQAIPNIEQLSKWVDKGYKIVVTGPPTCSLTLKKEYLYILGQDPEYASLVQKISESTFDISEFLMYLHKEGHLKTDFKNEIGSVNYHLSCHLRAQNIGFKSRDLLRLVPNTQIRVINKCSGMDGGWGMRKECFVPSIEMGEKLVRECDKKEMDHCCSDCQLASLQIFQASDSRIASRHPITLLHYAYGLSND